MDCILSLSNDHNHAPSTILPGHSRCRRLNKDALKFVEKAIVAGVPAHLGADIAAARRIIMFRIAKTIYNAKIKRHRVMLDGRRPIQELMDEIGPY